jgi:2-keto-4-pentenoate hydratase/2-oxohepta-3-ene-1,7-dioic acid hydratase in catechol pathway
VDPFVHSDSLLPEPIRRPDESFALDYEAELAVVIGRSGRRISRDKALDHVAGYSLFNDASLCDFQLRTPQCNFYSPGASHSGILDHVEAGICKKIAQIDVLVG